MGSKKTIYGHKKRCRGRFPRYPPCRTEIILEISKNRAVLGEIVTSEIIAIFLTCHYSAYHRAILAKLSPGAG